MGSLAVIVVPHRASIAPVLRLPTRLRALPRRGWQRALAHVLHAQRRPRVSSPGGAPSVLLPRLRPLERRHRAHHVRRPPRAVVEGGHPRPAERARAPRRRVVLRRLLRPHPVDRRRPRSRGRVVLDRRSRTERAGVPSLLLLPPAVVRCRVRGGGVLPRRREARRVDAIGGGDGSACGQTCVANVARDAASARVPTWMPTWRIPMRPTRRIPARRVPTRAERARLPSGDGEADARVRVDYSVDWARTRSS